MRRGLRTQISLTITLIILLTITLISFLANIFINREFNKYIEEQQKIHSKEIADSLQFQYDSITGEWDVSYIHGVGMAALYDGYIIKLYDLAGEIVWDAESHDMFLCTEIMNDIINRMKENRPDVDGQFISQDYDLKPDEQKLGTVSVSYYGPYFLSENDFQFLNTLNVILLLAGLISLICSLAAGGVLVRRIARPITKTAYIAKQISDGNYNIRFEGKTKTRELDELVSAVNHLAAELAAQENLRKQLTTDVAHELRTPLTSLRSHLEAMILGVWEATTARLQSCYEEIDRISRLVADLEQLAQVESENLILKKTAVDLFELARTVSSNFEIESATKNISLMVRGDSAVICVDRDRLNQVISNLLSNAIKYTHENGHIDVTVENTEKSVTITIADDGIGIPADELPLIFERFYRTDKSRNRKTGGAGIGLAIVKSIVIAHGGTVKAESQIEQGSRLTVVLPK